LQEVVERPFLLFYAGASEAPVDSKRAKNDFRKLLGKAKRGESGVCYAREQVPAEEFDLLVDLINRGVGLKLIVGKSQDPMLLARLQAKGVKDVWVSEQKISSALAVVDNACTMCWEGKGKVIPGKAKPRQQLVVFNDRFVDIINDRFEKLLSSSTR